MKIIAIGDTHGRYDWSKIVDRENDADKIVFIGDYVDTHENIPPEIQLSNLRAILGFKRANPEQVVLLIGNHDFHYLRAVNEHYSGYQIGYCHDFQNEFEIALMEGLMQMAFRHEKFLFTHAGVTHTWADKFSISKETPDETINMLFKQQVTPFKFRIGKNGSMSGNDVTQGPIWVRPQSLALDKIDNFIQVVGHTNQDSLLVTGPVANHGIIFIDTIGTSGEYLRITDGNMEAIKVHK